MSISELQIMFSKFNEMYFDNALPTIPIKLFKSKSFLGLFSYNPRVNDKCVIKISTYYILTTKQIEETLIHEMIHLWQYVNSYRDAHGLTFKRKMNEINARGLHCIDVAETGNPAPAIVKPSYIVVWDDNFGYHLSKFTNIVNARSGLKRLERYKSSNSGFICYEIIHKDVELMSSCRTKIKWYNIQYNRWMDELYPACIREIDFN